MKAGHLMALTGAVVIAAGGVACPWQEFVTAGVVAFGYETPAAGQLVLVAAVVVGMLSLLGLAQPHRRVGAAALLLSMFVCVALVAAHMVRSTAFELQPLELVRMADGYALAVWGTVVMGLGALIVVATEGGLDASADCLRVALIWRGTVVHERLLQRPATFWVGESPRNDLVLPTPHLPARFPLFRTHQPGRFAMGMSTEIQGEVTVDGEAQPLIQLTRRITQTHRGVDFAALDRGVWGLVRFDDELALYFQVTPPEAAGAVARSRPLRALGGAVSAAVAVSFLLQVGLLLLAVFGWRETPARPDAAAHRKRPRIEAVIARSEHGPPAHTAAEPRAGGWSTGVR